MNETEPRCDVPERLVPGTLSWELYKVEHQQRYQWASKYCDGKDILDVACGVGYGSEILARQGAASVRVIRKVRAARVPGGARV